MKKVKNARTGIATKRAKDLLDFHIGLLNSPKRKFYSYMGEGYYLEGDINPQNSDDYVRIGYTVDKKFLSRTFNLEFKTVFHDVDLSEDFNLKIKFTGFPKIEATYFKSKKGEKTKYESLYNDPKLLATIEKYAKIVDIGYIMVYYSKEARKLTITVSPYAGALLWLVFPPLFLKMPLKEEEIEALWESMMAIRRYTEKMLKKGV